MNNILKAVHENICELFPNMEKQQVIEHYDNSSVTIAIQIAEYAHRNQKQLNGEDYVLHAYDCLKLYRNFVRIKEDDYFCIDTDEMDKRGIPFKGVQEVCMLHDVLEDSELTIDDIEYIFNSLNLDTYFKLYIKNPLLLITHEKSDNYIKYMEKVLKNPISSMAKMMDLTNNMNLLRLNKFDKIYEQRFLNYFKYFKLIEEKYHYIEKVNEYLKRIIGVSSKVCKFY